ncbi:MAG: DNA recombination/repair protein RecA, partial [Candidatus Celaenobacter antarcticus]|nr:DNA recombination/repair protein RecA [Candidatus Celaenobacter antarcticus]
MKKEDYKESLDTAMGQIRKKYGEGSIMRLGEGARIDIETIP